MDNINDEAQLLYQRLALAGIPTKIADRPVWDIVQLYSDKASIPHIDALNRVIDLIDQVEKKEISIEHCRTCISAMAVGMTLGSDGSLTPATTSGQPDTASGVNGTQPSGLIIP